MPEMIGSEPVEVSMVEHSVQTMLSYEGVEGAELGAKLQGTETNSLPCART